MTVAHQHPGGLRFQSQVLNPGRARARMIVLSSRLSFWGGFDPKTGIIIDQHHPEAGVCVAGMALVLPGSRGSAGTPAGVAESLRVGRGPAAIIVSAVDVNIMIGAAVATKLYQLDVPVVAVNNDDYPMLVSGHHVTISEDGSVMVQAGVADQ